MPAEFKEGTINSYDPDTQVGSYKEDGTNIDRSFETIKPVVTVQPQQSITVMFKTPSGKEVNIAVKIAGQPV